MKKVVHSANQSGREISVCGDMAHQEQYLPFLLGIGVRILSMDPSYLPKIQKAISGIDLDEAEASAENMLAQTKINDLTRTLDLNCVNE
jgi:phosphotransferase system enzyme I (PtsP)